jgi:hypothetical protein
VRLHFRETIELLVEAIVRHQKKSSALKATMVIVMYGQRLPRLFSWRSGMIANVRPSGRRARGFLESPVQGADRSGRDSMSHFGALRRKIEKRA